MAFSFVIVESPAKVKTLSKILGNDYIIKASIGHIRDLPKKGIGIKISKTFDFSPKYEIMPEKQDVIKELTSNAKKAKTIFLAPDPDREGEAIAWHLYNIFKEEKVKSSIKRIEFNEITKDAILNAIKNPKKINIDRVNAQQARRILDRLVGYKISPLLWQKIGSGLSAGRVQSVAVRLICEKEAEIENFVPQEYWIISEELSKTKKGDAFVAELAKINNKKAEITNQAEADEIVKILKKAPHLVGNINITEQKKSPSPPFITSTLQQDASRYYNFTVKKTMSLAQHLYEGIELGQEGAIGLITYMRTDSPRISDEARNMAKEYIVQKYGKEFLPSHPRQYKSKSGAQDAHEAIRPTEVERTPEKIKNSLSADHYRLYKLIWERFVASQMENSIYDVINVDIKAENCLLKASATSVKFLGFQILSKEENPKDNVFKLLSQLKLKDKLIVNKISPKQYFTQPPSRYSEATLVRDLEEKNIGRPSTYAPTISVIQDRGYVTKEGKHLLPTLLGKQVNNQLVTHFHNIVNVDFTSQMEDSLDKIEDGKQEWQTILKDFYKPFLETLKKASQEMQPVVIPSDEICEVCGKQMVIKKGRFGEYLACSDYPNCKHTKYILKKIGVKCPTQGCEGEIIQKRSKRGFLFYACTEYPKCNFASYNPPTNQPCPNCGTYTVVKFSKKKKPYVVCSNKECNTFVKISRKPKE